MALAAGKFRLLLAGVLALLGFAGYELGWHLWGVYHYRAAQIALERRDFRQAADHLDRAVRAWPTDPSVRLVAAQTARRQGATDQAVIHLQACTRSQGPAEAVALEYRLLHVQEGDLGEGPLLLRLAGEQPEAPETALIQEALIEGCLKFLAATGSMGFTRDEVAAQPELSWARQALQWWLQQRPGQADQAQGLVWRGRAHDIANEHAQAVADLRKAVELDPDHFQPRWYLAASIGQEAPDAAADHFAVLLQRYPENKQVRLMLALGRRGSGRLEESRQLLDELLAANPDDFPVLVERGKLALDAEQPADAEQWLRRAETIAPYSPDVNLALGRTLYLLGRAEEAQRYQERFRQFDAEQTQQRKDLVAKVKSMRKTVNRE